MTLHTAPPPFKRSDPFPDRGMLYGDWYSRERAAGRHTKPGPQAINRGLTPRGYNHTPPRARRPAWDRTYGPRGPHR